MSRDLRRRRNFHINSCVNKHTGLNKVAYESKSAANRAADALGKKEKTYIASYKCAYCQKYHIGRP